MAESGIEYHVRAILETQRAAGAMSKQRKWAKGISNAGAQMQSMGRSIMGTSAATAALFAKATVAAAALAGTYGFGRLVQSAISFNAQLEQSRFSIAATLQLMGHVGGDFARNLKISEALSERIFKIAATSPASFKQAQSMFENMLPGARAVTGNMEDILKLTKQSLSLGIVMGGDFRTTGAQLSRILTGAAGAEFQTWKVLQTPILEAGKALKIFNKDMVISQKLTEEFNKLAPEQRFDLVTTATEKLGEATEAAGFMWMGMTSAISSSIDMMRKAMGEGIFDVLKGRMRGGLAKGGFLDPGGETVTNLNQAAKFLGYHLRRAADYLFGRFEAATRYFADNWESVFFDLTRWSDRFSRIVKIMVAGAVARTGAGAATMVGGAALSGIGTVAQLVAGLGAASLIAIPGLILAGGAILGIGALFGGVAAFFIDNMDMIISSVQSGAVSLFPLFFALDTLWAKLVALGEAMLGTGSSADKSNAAVTGMGTAVNALTSALSIGLRVLGAVQFAFNVVKIGIGLIGIAFVEIINFMLKYARSTIEALGVTAPSNLNATIDSLDVVSLSLLNASKEAANNANEMWNLAKVFDAAKAKVGGPSLWSEWTEKLKKTLTDLGTEGRGKGTFKRPKSVTHIHKLIVNQDLRNSDPDRVIGAFYKAVDRSVDKRTQALGALPEGV